MRIFLIDTTLSGHHLTYLQLFAKAFIDLQHELAIISPAVREQLFDEDYGSRDQVYIHTIKDELPDFHGGGPLAFRKYIKYTWTWLKGNVDDAIELTKNSPDLIFFSTIDPYIGPYVTNYEVNSYFPYPWTGLYMKPQNIVEKWSYSFARKLLLNPNNILKSSKSKAIGIFVEPCAKELSAIINKPVVIFPDIVDVTSPDLSASMIEEINRKAGGRKIISLIGSLEKRKGILTLLKAVKQLPEDEFFFICAGQLSKSSFTDDELAFINDTTFTNVYFYFERIPSEGIFNAIISISTLVYAAYIKFPFSSNLVGKAASFKKPLLVTSHSYMGAVVEKYRLGKLIEEGNAEETEREIITMTSVKYLKSFITSNNCEQYTYDNSYPQFLIKLKDLLRYYH